MKAILVKEKGQAGNLTIEAYENPGLKEGFVLVKNKAFGINRAEIYMRKGEWGETHEIIGIEFCGIVEEDSTNTYKKGQKVISFVGGLARDFGGSYAEYVSVPVQNIIPVETSLHWEELGAIPESFATAWSILNWGLCVKEGDSIVVRGGTSSVGLAMITLAKQMNLQVIATSRAEGKLSILKSYGADDALVDDGKIADNVKQFIPGGVVYVADLIGTNTLADSLDCCRPHGTVCLAGFLGGLKPLENFMPLIQIPSSVRLTSFGTAFVVGSENFPYSAIPMQKIVADIEQKKIKNILAATFPFEQIAEAHKLMESNTVNGKIVVTV